MNPEKKTRKNTSHDPRAITFFQIPECLCPVCSFRICMACGRIAGEAESNKRTSLYMTSR